jgi:cholesterol transport system auxiliary component
MTTPGRRAAGREPSPRALILAALSALLVIGCALTSKSDPIVPRYFTPERAVDGPPRRSPGTGAELRLGRVTSASHLDERLVYRDSDHELGYYQERRWTEAPDEYLKRRLARALFEERGLRRVVAGAAATLDVELVAFDEIRAPKRIARVQVIARLSDQRFVRWEETLTVDQPLGAATADAAVLGLGAALGEIVERIVDRVVTELAAPPPAPGGGAAASTPDEPGRAAGGR